MIMHVVYRLIGRLIGHDKQSEKLAVACDVPRNAVAQAKSIAGIIIPHASQVGDRELTPTQSQEIARLIRAPWDAARYDCFLERYALQGQTATT
jgi:hypothetical protein